MKLLNVNVKNNNEIDTSGVEEKISGLQSNLQNISQNILYSGEMISRAIENSSEKI